MISVWLLCFVPVQKGYCEFYFTNEDFMTIKAVITPISRASILQVSVGKEK